LSRTSKWSFFLLWGLFETLSKRFETLAITPGVSAGLD
jgi:hypothetical protein